MKRLIAPRASSAALWAFLAVLTGTPGLAQHYHVHTYTEGDGLPSSTVQGVTQDALGRIWFATRAGVAVYDGKAWETFTSAGGLVPPDRGLIVVDDEGTLWAAATSGSDIARFDGERWSSVVRPGLRPGCRLADLVVDHRASAARITLGTSCGLLIWEDGTGRRIDLIVNALARLGDELLVATPDGLFTLGGGDDRLERARAQLPPGPVLGLARDTLPGPDTLWVVGLDWVGRIATERFEMLAEGLEVLDDPQPMVTTPDGDGGLFFADLVTLRHYHPQHGLQLLDERNGLISGGAEEVFLDREGNLWAASRRGVTKIVSFRFATYRPDHGLLEDEVTAILERRRGGLVLGHRGGLTFRSPEGEFSTFEFPGARRLESERVLDLAEHPDGTIWIAGNAMGLGRLAGGELSWSHPHGDARVHSVLVDHRGRLWVAAGSIVLVAGAGRFETRLELEQGIGARRIVEGGHGSIFALSSGDGLYRIFEQGVERWRAPERTGLNNIYALLERPDGSRWVGTGSGLVEVVDDTLRKTRAPQPVIDRPIYFIVSDGAGSTWFGTDNGVLRWDGKRLTHYTVEDGLAGRETNRAAGLFDSDGRLWIGTTHGASVYRGELDRRVPVPPALGGLDLEASGEHVSLARTVRLRARRNDLVFSFRAIYFSDERNVLLRRWLEGYEPGWSSEYTSADQRVRYTSLPAGRYRFHVQAGNREGLWSETVSSPEILIAAPVWRRAWFWGVVIAAGLALLYVAQRYINQARYARRLEAEVGRRVGELRRAEEELAKAQKLEALGLLAGGIGHDFNNLLMAIRGSLSMLAGKTAEKHRKWIARADTAVERARELTAQLVTFSRGGAPVRSAARIGDVIRDSVSFVMRGQSLRCEIDLPPDLRVVEIDAGQINQVINNLLLNAIEAMPGGGTIHVTGRNVDHPLSMLPPGKYIEIAVRDDGDGIPEKHRHRIFDPYFSTKEGGSGLGLATAYNIVRRHEGLLTVESTPRRGTTFTIYLPASDAEIAPPLPQPEIASFVGARILVMDDEPAVREVMSEMLDSLGCIVTATANGDEALRSYERALREQRGFDAVIFDLTVPGEMGGEEAMRRLLDLDPAARAVVASGYFNAPVMSHYREHGFRAVLKKPFRIEDLAVALRQALAISVRS